jgi:UDP-glucose:(heptosyl)LPS alpha-1,3-glucosyltransferase
MKLALVRQKYNPYGGAERFVERAMLAIRAAGADLTLITREWPEDDGEQVLRCNPFYIGSLWRDWGFARGVTRLLRQHRFDLVQSHERIIGCDIYRAGDGVHAEWLQQRRRVLGMAGRLRLALNPYHAYMQATEREMFQSPRLRAVICISKMVKQEIQGRFGVSNAKLHVLYNGVDTERFHPQRVRAQRAERRAALGYGEDDVVYLMVGSGFERKGVAMLLEAMRLLPDHARLLVVGHDKKLEHYRAMARRLGLAPRVCFAGGQDDVLPYYGAADVFAMPTLYEPFGNVILEAMACGLPVVTSTKCGGGELIVDGHEGAVVDALDVGGFAAALSALADRHRRDEAAQAARRRAEAYTLENMAAGFNALYRELLAPAAAAVH